MTRTRPSPPTSTLSGLKSRCSRPDRVRGDEAARGLEEHLEDLAPRSRPALEPRRQRVALDELHRDVQVAVVGGADVVDADDVGVRELGDRLGLAPQPRLRASLAFVPRFGAQELERDLAIELGIVGGEHHAHAAGCRASTARGSAPPDRRSTAHRQLADLRLGDGLLVRGDGSRHWSRGRRRRRERGDERAAVPARARWPSTLVIAVGASAARHELAGDVVVEALHRPDRVAKLFRQPLEMQWHARRPNLHRAAISSTPFAALGFACIRLPGRVAIPRFIGFLAK